MTHEKSITRFFTPTYKSKGQKHLFNLLLCFSIITLSGCATTEYTSPIAPSPPSISMSQKLVKNENILIKTPINTSLTLKSKCNIKDRFDRKSVLAYEWGRSKLSLDLDGINLKNSSTKAILIQYKLRIQPEKTEKQRCRFPSNWQGLIGSSYNELFIRKDQKIWDEITNMVKI